MDTAGRVRHAFGVTESRNFIGNTSSFFEQVEGSRLVRGTAVSLSVALAAEATQASELLKVAPDSKTPNMACATPPLKTPTQLDRNVHEEAVCDL